MSRRCATAASPPRRTIAARPVGSHRGSPRSANARSLRPRPLRPSRRATQYKQSPAPRNSGGRTTLRRRDPPRTRREQAPRGCQPRQAVLRTAAPGAPRRHPAAKTAAPEGKSRPHPPAELPCQPFPGAWRGRVASGPAARRGPAAASRRIAARTAPRWAAAHGRGPERPCMPVGRHAEAAGCTVAWR